MKRLAFALLVLAASPAFSQRGGPKGQGAIVIRDDAPVYAHSDGDVVEYRMKKGNAISGIMMTLLAPAYQLDEVKGRVHVMYFAGEQKGMNKTAWMDPKDLSRFTFDGSCGPKGTPLVMKGFSQRWNVCFEEARDNKLDVLRALWAQAAPTPVQTDAPLPEPTLPAPSPSSTVAEPSEK